MQDRQTGGVSNMGDQVMGVSSNRTSPLLTSSAATGYLGKHVDNQY